MTGTGEETTNDPGSQVLTYGMSDGQVITLSVITTLSGLLSIFGSSYIAYHVLSNEKIRSKMSNRFVLAISIVDIISSFGLILGCYLLPRETGAAWARGNNTTSSVAAFLSHFVVAQPITSFNLSLYFLWTIRYGWKDESMLLFEKAMHTVAFLFVLCINTIALLSDGFNPHPVFLGPGITKYPPGCNTKGAPESNPCTRGLWSKHLFIVISLVIGPCTFLSTCNTYIVYKTVVARNTMRTEGSEGMNARLREAKVMRQAVLYFLSYLNSIAWMGISTLVPWLAKLSMADTGGPYFYVMVLLHFFMPLQGFLNFIIFHRRAAMDLCGLLHVPGLPSGSRMFDTSSSHIDGQKRQLSDKRFSVAL